MHHQPNMHKVLTWDEKGTARYNVEVAAMLHDAELREWRAAMQDLERLGIVDAFPPQGTPSGGSSVGDIHTQVTEPGQRYWESWSTPRARPEQDRPIVTRRPECLPLPPEVEPYRVIIERTLGPQIEKAFEKLKCGPFFTQPMTWLAPPITAISVDVFTSASGVFLPGGEYGGPGDCVDVLRIDVPDRWIFVLDRFGNELEDHTVWGDVRFSFQRNRSPIRSYGDFDVQLGRFVNPTKFGTPIILKHKDEFRVVAQAKGATPHTAFARIIGWAFAVRTITGDGTYTEFCVQ